MLLMHGFVTLHVNTLVLGHLILCPLRNFSYSDFFSKSTSSKISFKNTIRVSNSSDPHQAGHFVGPDVGPNCLQKLSADDTRG